MYVSVWFARRRSEDQKLNTHTHTLILKPLLSGKRDNRPTQVRKELGSPIVKGILTFGGKGFLGAIFPGLGIAKSFPDSVKELLRSATRNTFGQLLLQRWRDWS